MITEIDGVAYDVIDEPGLVAELRRLDAQHVGTVAMTDYAVEHGARPTGWTQGDPIPMIDLLWDPDGGPGLFVWATDDEPAADDEYGDDPWAGLTDRPAHPVQ